MYLTLPPDLVQLIDSYRDKRVVEHLQVKWCCWCYLYHRIQRLSPYTGLVFPQVEPGIIVGYRYRMVQYWHVEYWLRQEAGGVLAARLVL